MNWKKIDLTAGDMGNLLGKKTEVDKAEGRQESRGADKSGGRREENGTDKNRCHRKRNDTNENEANEKEPNEDGRETLQDCERPYRMEKDIQRDTIELCGNSGAEKPSEGSPFLVAQDDAVREQQKDLLYEVLGPVFFGEKQACSAAELEQLFGARYGIDVQNDFYEGDEHYEEYLEAQQAIAEGMSIYGGWIGFADGALAELAEQIWEKMERKNGGRFRRINTMLEE